MKTIGVIFEITNNPHFGALSEEYSDRLSEYVKPTEINCICETYAKLGYDYKIIDGAKGLLEVENKKECVLYFNKSIGFKGLERKILVPAIAQLFNLPLIGTSAYPMTLARHKYHTNRLLHGFGLRVPEAIYLENESQAFNIRKFPVIVKPNMESDALGITDNSICHTRAEVSERVKYLFTEFNQPVVIEEYISGPEWKVAVIGNGTDSKSYGCVNTLKNGKDMSSTLQTRDDILNRTLSYGIPDKTPLLAEALETSEKIHCLMGLSDYSRCDYRIGDDGKLYCMEVSTHPFISDNTSSFVLAAKQTSGSLEAVLESITNSALKRYGLIQV